MQRLCQVCRNTLLTLLLLWFKGLIYFFFFLIAMSLVHKTICINL